MKNKRLFRRTPVIVMAILFSALLGTIMVPRVFATNPSFVSLNIFTGLNVASAASASFSVTAGNTLIVPVYLNICGCATTVSISDSQGNSFSVLTDLVSNGNIRLKVFTALSLLTTGSDIVTATWTGTYDSSQVDIFQYTGVTGFGSSASNTALPGGGSGTDTLTLTAASTSQVFQAGLILNSVNSSCGTQALVGVQRDSNCDVQGPTDFLEKYYEATSLGGSQGFTDTFSGYTTINGFIHFAFEIQGSGGTGGSGGNITSCYGNCGTPPITLANTNSTAGINFNTTITVFYEFQSQINGFINNASLNYATNCASGNKCNANTLFFGIYSVSSCPVTNVPFTSQCPGVLIAQTNPSPPTKQRYSIVVSGISVFAGEWLAVAVSASFSGISVNDTNTNVPLFQTSGNLPAVIAQSSSASTLCAGCKMGAWMYITGVNPTSTTTPTNTNCAGLLDCLLPNWVNSLCSNPTTVCRNISGMIWAGGLAIFFTFFTLKGWGEMSFAGNTKLPIVDVFLFWGLIWMLAMGGLALTFVWIPLFFFLVIALMFGKHGTFL